MAVYKINTSDMLHHIRFYNVYVSASLRKFYFFNSLSLLKTLLTVIPTLFTDLHSKCKLLGWTLDVGSTFGQRCSGADLSNLSVPFYSVNMCGMYMLLDFNEDHMLDLHIVCSKNKDILVIIVIIIQLH